MNLNGIVTRQIYSWANSADPGGGRFLYYNNNKSLSIQVSSCNFWCMLSADLSLNKTFYLNTVANQQFYYGSTLYLNSQNASLTASIQYNYFQSCTLAEKGAGIRIEMGSPSVQSSINIGYNYFLYNLALQGGSIYCKYCNITSFKGNEARSNKSPLGAFMYLESPTSKTLSMDSNTIYSIDNFYGAFTSAAIIINDTLSTASDSFSVMIS